jgi:hypothetical protein
VYLERAIAALRGHGIQIEDESLARLSPIGWEHINLTGDYPMAGHRTASEGQIRAITGPSQPQTSESDSLRGACREHRPVFFFAELDFF